MTEGIAIIGLGTMGRKIARLCLLHGFDVAVMSRSHETGKKHVEQITADLTAKAERGQLKSEQVDSMLERLSLVDRLGELTEIPFVIEAISEEIEAKEALYRQIEPHLDKNAIVATNTSSLSVRELSAGLKHRSRFLGMHFFNPPDVMRLVEIRGSDQTSRKALEVARGVATRLGRNPLIVPDEPGYYVNRILFPMLIEGIRVLDSSREDPKDIDDALKLGANMPMGPLELCDYIGLDIVIDICQILRERTNEDRFETPELIMRMVAEGKLGRKSGEGFYKY